MRGVPKEIATRRPIRRLQLSRAFSIPHLHAAGGGSGIGVTAFFLFMFQTG